MEATYTIKGDASKGSSSTAVWNEYSYVYDLTNHQVVQQTTRTFAFDRRTAQLVNCCGASVNGDTSVRQTGVVGDVFPIGTQKQTYQVFDTTLNRTVPFGTPDTSSRTSTGASAREVRVSAMPAWRPAAVAVAVNVSWTDDDSAIQLRPARMPLMMASVVRSSAYTTLCGRPSRSTKTGSKA